MPSSSGSIICRPPLSLRQRHFHLLLPPFFSVSVSFSATTTTTTFCSLSSAAPLHHQRTTATTHATARLHTWMSQNDTRVERYRKVVTELKAQQELDLTMLSVGLRELQVLVPVICQ